MTATSWSPRGPLWRGLAVLVFGVAGFAAWAALTEVNGAVVASGIVQVEAQRQAIQHPDGGLISTIHVREGEVVAAGAPILTLDATEVEAQRGLLMRELFEALAQLDRFGAEVRGDPTVQFSAELQTMAAGDAALAAVLDDEAKLFASRRATLEQTLAQFGERQVQTEAAIEGRLRQLTAGRRTLELAREDLATQESLFERGLTQAQRVSTLRREVAASEGEIGELEAGIAEARSAIAGYRIEGLRTEAAWREAAQSELRALQPRAAELRERLRVIETQLGRLTLRAPMAGTVLDLRVHTLGGVMQAGAEIASIVPADAPLVLTVEIDPGQIDRIHQGQQATIRFPNFNARLTPEVSGEVRTVSADAIQDPSNGRRYFTVQLLLSPGALEELGEELLPGMPVEAFIQTDARSPASFLLKPLADYMTYALREE